MMLDMGRIKALWRDMDRAHAHVKGGRQIARVIFKHGGAGRVQPVQRKDLRKSALFGFGAVIGMLYAVNRIEQAAQPARLGHAQGVVGRPVCVDDPAARKGGDMVAQLRIGAQDREIYIMHMLHIGHRVDAVILHQPCQRCAILHPIAVAQMRGFVLRHAKRIHHIADHALLDLVEKPHFGWVKRVIKVKDPGTHICEIFGWHGAHSSGFLSKNKVTGVVIWRDPVFCKLEKIQSYDMTDTKPLKDAYTLILEAIDLGVYKPGDRLVESELAERFGVSRTPIREALQRLETQSLLTRDGRSLIVASLDHNQLAELYVVRSELEGLAARLAARHATQEEVRLLRGMIEEDRALMNQPQALSRANKRFHKQIHLASHNRYLVQQLDLVHRSMALLATTSLSFEGRGLQTLEEHSKIVEAIAAGDGDRAYDALKQHISLAFETRLRQDSMADARYSV